jgi:peptidoglycan/LPS O-acetylase OafA/YrhL
MVCCVVSVVCRVEPREPFHLPQSVLSFCYYSSSEIEFTQNLSTEYMINSDFTNFCHYFSLLLEIQFSSSEFNFSIVLRLDVID